MSPADSPQRIIRIGYWLESDNHKACEIARLAGYELVIFDMEHGTIAESALDRLIPFCSGIGLQTHVRVSEATQPRIQHALDMGADAVILPQIRDLAHARSVTAFSKYPPRGMRGLGYSRTQDYGAADGVFIARENNTRQCYAMIETAGALADVMEIAALDCVDGLFVGPGDLSLTRGRGVFAAGADDFADLEQIAAAARQQQKPWGAAAANRDYRRRAFDLGADFLTTADDLSALVVGFRNLIS